MIQLMIMGFWRFIEDKVDLTDFSNLKFNGFLKFEFLRQKNLKFQSLLKIQNENVRYIKKFKSLKNSYKKYINEETNSSFAHP